MARPEEREVLRQNLEGHKRELRLAVHELREAALGWPDPREHIREQPVRWLLGGLVLGLWLGWSRR
jgi:hypothetical protein